MTFTESISQCLNKYATFDGTARRSEYWWFSLFYTVGNIAIGWFSQWLSLAFVVAMLVPMIAVTCRRLHDTDRSGWWQLIGIVPIVGWIVMIVFLVQESRPNRYGTPSAAVA